MAITHVPSSAPLRVQRSLPFDRAQGADRAAQVPGRAAGLGNGGARVRIAAGTAGGRSGASRSRVLLVDDARRGRALRTVSLDGPVAPARAGTDTPAAAGTGTPAKAGSGTPAQAVAQAVAQGLGVAFVFAVCLVAAAFL